MNEPALRRAVRAEWGPLFRTVWLGLATRKLRAIPLTLAAICLTSVFQIVQNQDWGYQPIQNVGSVRAEEPVWLALLRTPLSLFVPALDLPVWGALAQLLVVFGICEIALGRLRTLAVAYVATLAGTMYARIGIAIGPESVVGLPASDAHVSDTGPSAAVVGLAIFVCWRYRAWLTCSLVVAAMFYEVFFIKNNLAGKEHIAAVAAVLVLCGVWEVRHRSRKPKDAHRDNGSGRLR
ncbi:hypothetical protein [Streptomyces sp. MST-110588]|uniref:hypothetical protein n=1 Tax=Streptomyces sp. MST-110588 TaxID=2833628 RepID=UPI001F5C4CD7|nr:hypothetical protein [Streptomyces sp. MST-110588]UNO42501.1 hypothetical protein KGS77_26935 [Streptomyces sp. MST-110588]